MNYKKTYIPQKGYTPLCKIEQCSLKKLAFGIIDTCDKETAPVIKAIFCGAWLAIIRALTAALTPSMHGWKTCKERKNYDASQILYV